MKRINFINVLLSVFFICSCNSIDRLDDDIISLYPIIEIEPPSEEGCLMGGIKITSVENGELVTNYVCNGENGKDGKSYYVEEVQPGEDCLNGGLRVITEEEGELVEYFICNGKDGKDAFLCQGEVNYSITVSENIPSDYCELGGYVIILSVDSNRNGYFEDYEKEYSYFCNSCGCDDDGGLTKIAVCHKEERSGGVYMPGYHTIYVRNSELQSHLDAGDIEGECN